MGYSIPTNIRIGEKYYSIRDKGDYRTIIDCFDALSDMELSENYRIFTALVIFYEDLNDIEDIPTVFKGNLETAVKEMFDFFNCGVSHNKKDENVPNYKLFDWKTDEQLICAAINMALGKEIRLEPYIHWWSFMGYFNNIPKDSTFAFILSIRHKICRGKKLEKYEKEFKRDNPQYFRRNNGEDEQMDIIRQMWENGGKL